MVVSLADKERIIDLIADGHQMGAELLYQQYGAALYGVIFRWVKDQQLAEHILTQTFTDVYRNIQHFKKEHCFFIAMLKSAKTRVKQEIQDFGNYTHSLLHPKENTVLELMLNQGLTLKETASILQLTEVEVKNELRSALKTIPILPC